MAADVWTLWVTERVRKALDPNWRAADARPFDLDEYLRFQERVRAERSALEVAR